MNRCVNEGANGTGRMDHRQACEIFLSKSKYDGLARKMRKIMSASNIGPIQSNDKDFAHLTRLAFKAGPMEWRRSDRGNARNRR